MRPAAVAARERQLDRRGLAHGIAVRALRSLHAELTLYPKPGLVSLRDSGAHVDMDARAFVRSIAALRTYFRDIAELGASGAAFIELRRRGVEAEARMLAATRGVNTHRGAIFALGLLVAAMADLRSRGRAVSDRQLRRTIGRWRGDLIALEVARDTPSHGRWVAARYGVGGARAEAAAGFPSVFDVALPALRDALARGASERAAHLHALFALLGYVDDTNVLYRAGATGLRWLRSEAEAFLLAGSVFAADWESRAESIHRRCSERGISPGGCADLFSAAWFVHQSQRDA